MNDSDSCTGVISTRLTKQAFLYGDLEDDEPIYITPARLQIHGSSRFQSCNFRRGLSYNCSRQSMELFRLLEDGTQRSRLGWRITVTNTAL